MAARWWAVCSSSRCSQGNPDGDSARAHVCMLIQVRQGLQKPLGLEDGQASRRVPLIREGDMLLVSRVDQKEDLARP